MESPFTVINENGRVLFSGIADDPARTQASKGTVILEQAPPDTYWDDTTFVPLLQFSTDNALSNPSGWLANGVDVISIGPALPNPTTVRVTCTNPMYIQADDLVITDGSLELTAQAPGIYSLTLTADRYQTKTYSVTATSP